MKPKASIRTDIDRLNQEGWELRLCNQARCIALSQKALEESSAHGYGLGLGYAWRNLGYCAYQSANYAEAIQLLRQGLEVAQQQDDPVLRRDCLNYLGAVLAVQGEIGSALGYVEQTLEINQTLGDQRGIATCLDNMGYLYHRMGQDDLAVKVRTEALHISRQIGNPVREAHVLMNLSANHIQLNQHSQAIRLAREGLALARLHQLEQLQPIALQNLGEALTAEGQHIEALMVLNLSIELAERQGLPQCLIQSWLNLAVLELALGHPQKAEALLIKALHEASQVGLGELQYQIHLRLSQTYKRLGNFEQALYHHECFYHLERTIRDAQAEQRLRTLSVQRELEKTQAEAELTFLRNVELAQAVRERENAIVEKNLLLKELEHQVTLDHLTGVYNRRYLEAMLAQEFDKARVAAHPLPVAMMDVDNFKSINDRFSHQVGDKVLQTVAQVAKASARVTDMVARYGGEEFVLVLPRTTPEQAQVVCERVRQAVEQYPWELIQPGLRVTLSLGLASDTTLPNHEKLLDMADGKLYQAKQNGKNRLVI